MKKTAFIISLVGCLLTLASCSFKQEVKPIETTTINSLVSSKTETKATTTTSEVKVGFKYDIKGTYKEQYDDAIWELTDTQAVRTYKNMTLTFEIERYTEHYALFKNPSWFYAYMEDDYIFLFKNGELQYTLQRVTE